MKAGNSMDVKIEYRHIKKVIAQTILLFNKPYDLFESKKHRLIFSFGISGFLWFFLFTFGVFDFDYFSFPDRLYYTGIYSLVCLITLLLNSFLLQDYVLKKTTLAGAFVWSLWLICCIALSNFLLTTVFFKWEEFSMYTLMKNQIYTLSVWLIVTPVVILTHYNYILRKTFCEAAGISLKTKRTSEKELINFFSKYKNGKFEVEINKLLYIQSADNYIDIWYKVDSSIQHKLIRNTLVSFEKSIPHPTLIRCHRSFIININHVKSIKGKTGGYKLIIENIDIEIPLSRKYKDTVFSVLKI